MYVQIDVTDVVIGADVHVLASRWDVRQGALAADAEVVALEEAAIALQIEVAHLQGDMVRGSAQSSGWAEGRPCTSVGSEPLMALYWSHSTDRWGSCPISDGIVPDRLFSSSTSRRRDVSNPSSDGIVPIRLLR